MAGPKIPWRPGRIDGFAAQATPDGRLPDATQGADHLRNIFYRMGYLFSDDVEEAEPNVISASMIKKSSHFPVLTLSVAVTVTGSYFINIVTLIAADNPFTTSSGFEGPWTFSPTTLTNDYFKLLFDEKWVWKKWDGPKQLEDKKTRSLMMLPCVL